MNEGKRCSVLVFINPASEFYSTYTMYVRPYLENFGIPFIEADSRVSPGREGLAAFQLILAGHRGAFDSTGGIAVLKSLADTVYNGAGLVSFDPDIFAQSEVFSVSVQAPADVNVSSYEIADAGHYITEAHNAGENFELFRGVTPDASYLLKDGRVLLSGNGVPVLEAASFGRGRIVKWNDISWMSHEVRGPVFGMDDLLWRGMVWASAKPFVMQGMPPFVSMRVDDVWGSARSGRTDDPLYWVGVCNKYGIKPWLGLFLNNMTPQAVSSVKCYVGEGAATVFPHAFSGYENSVDGTPFIEDWIYYDHRHSKDYSDEVMELNAMKVERWMDTNGLPFSKVALGHYYETGRNAIPYFLKWGCEFTGVHMKPGEPYLTPGNDGEWLKAGPYRMYESGIRSGKRPACYAHYLEVEGCPEYDRKLFNCLIEIRDDKGYEWAPDNDVQDTVDRGIKQLRRSFDSMLPAALFTHESDFIQNITPDNWEKIIEGVCDGIKAYAPIYVTTDDLYRYVRAKHDMRISDAMVSDGKLALRLQGCNDIATKCWVFYEQDGNIKSKLCDLPRVEGTADIELEIQ